MIIKKAESQKVVRLGKYVATFKAMTTRHFK